MRRLLLGLLEIGLLALIALGAKRGVFVYRTDIKKLIKL